MAQFVFLVHHADAVAGNVDHTRPLSALGVTQAEYVAKRLAERGAKPAAIWHSGKLRARQTAEACWRAVNPFAEFTAVRGLQPDDDPDTIATALAAEERDVLVTSHMPLLPALLHRMTTARRDRLSTAFPINGAVALERHRERDVWVETWRVSP
jgi:phosphohistidine phosphatase